jgi:hypothetical protein
MVGQLADHTAKTSHVFQLMLLSVLGVFSVLPFSAILSVLLFWLVGSCPLHTCGAPPAFISTVSGWFLYVVLLLGCSTALLLCRLLFYLWLSVSHTGRSIVSLFADVVLTYFGVLPACWLLR